ncbi:MAG: SusC/RagA family TonB-linked outer membrane protein [Cytophagales bacterium]|nr:SusC/RagA family TonB-linked outer membrane protein [Cytophagales bacterium]
MLHPQPRSRQLRAWRRAAGWLIVPLLAGPAPAQMHAQLPPTGGRTVPAPSPPQAHTINLRLRNAPLGKALEEVARKAATGIFYNPATLPAKTVTVDLRNVTPLQALQTLLEGTRLEPVLQGGDLIIRERSTPFEKAADRPVSGRVTDAQTGSPLPGVSVLLKGTAAGTVTDADGRFSLSLPPGGGTLVFSFIGMVTQEAAVTAGAEVNLALQPTTQSLGEVLVVGYGAQARRDITGAVATLSEKQLRAVPVAGLDQSLQGRVAGVQVTQTSGQPGGSVNVRIRGWSSISAGNEPLYVIDGIPFYNWGTTLNNGPSGIFGTGVVHNALSALNPNDIESIQVLKDAAAAAIYGSRAANGVVIITTKRGKAGQARIEFDSYYGMQQLARPYALLDAAQYAELINESRAVGRQIQGLTSPTAGPLALQPVPGLEDPAALGAGTDWQAEVFEKAPLQNHQLTLSGGNEHTQYAVSGSYYDQQGIVLASGYRRYSARLNLDQRVTGRLKIGSSVSVNNATNLINRASSFNPNQGGIIYGALLQTPTVPVYDPYGEYARPDYRYFDRIDNPVASARDYQHTINTSRLIGNLYGDLRLAEGLSFRTSVGLDANYLKNNIFIPTRGWAEGPPPGPGAGFAFASQELVWLNENTLSYDRGPGGAHRLSAVGGVTFQGSHFERMISRVFNFPNDLVTTTNGGQTNLTNSFAEDWRMVSLLGRANYAFGDKYLLTVAARTDGSSRFGPDRRFAFFPSVSAGWRLSAEPWLKGLAWLSDLKLRASYGLTGNSEILNTVNSFANYAHLGSVATANYAFGGGAVNGLAPATLTNRDLGWESTAQVDLGLDLALYAGRVNLTLDWYNKRTNDMLVGNTPLPFTTGFATAVLNVGSMRNRGWEASLQTTNLAGPFGWTTALHYAYNQNRVVSLGAAVREIALGNTLIRTGEPVSSFYGHVAEGLFDSAEEIAAAPFQDARTAPGDLRFRDVNADGVINNDDRTLIGNPLPDHVFGLTNAFTYKGLELSIFLNGVQGNEIVNFTRSKTENLNGYHNQNVSTLHRWRSPEQPGDGKMPRATAIDVNGNNRFSTRWLDDGSYLRCRTLTLGYSLPQPWMKAVRLSQVKLYATVQNLFTLTRYRGYDPEVGNSGNSPLQQGYDDSNYPVARTFLLGINIQL